jgi:hypothetical protein
MLSGGGAYVVWCGDVVVGLRGASPFLEAEFDKAVAAFKDADERRSGLSASGKPARRSVSAIAQKQV